MTDTPMLIDSHAHLDAWQTRGEAEAVLARACEAGVAAVVDVGADEATSRLAIELAGRHPRVFATVGGHPHDAAAYTEATWAEWRRLAASPRVVAVGECGLDYFRDLSPRDVQRRVFARHLALAKELALPVVIHCRDAYANCLDIVSAELGAPARGVMHCFLGDAATARRALDLGLHLGLGGSLTFPREEALRQVVAGLPLDRLVVETDSPYLTPRPLRGRNEPAHVRLVAERLAAVLGRPLDAVAAATTANARALFALPG
ncbi:MAG TPA: TatD family hydrolase [Planctomycetota bacterium]|nr:TatD family hydrolase [Planctomycetota bacterium]HRR81519.1 TatD family hydrolase [Planctomycetota bacterium]HRT92971.1 TatD family hydrolase [Planctomycetota bacterium]